LLPVALIVLVSVGLFSAAALVVTLATGAGGDDLSGVTAGSERLARLEKENRELRTSVESLRERIAAAEARDAAPRPAEPAPDAAALDRAVEAWFAKHGTAAVNAWLAGNPSGAPSASSGDPESEKAPEPDGKEALDLEEIFARLQGKNLWTPESRKLLEEVARAGRMAELVEVFHRHAKKHPQDASAQAAYGSMLIKACDHAPSDEAFDKALGLDPEHWEARFTKALAYTFWPAFTGKPAEAVTHFEQLIAQQERRRPEEHYAYTYLFLGNLHEQRGERAKALDVWRQGLRLFPNHEDLRKKLQ
jgi:tetratricopeptide (TPR) repeat protein